MSDVDSKLPQDPQRQLALPFDAWADPSFRTQFVEHEARRAIVAIADSINDVASAVVCGARGVESPIEAQFAVWFNTARAHELSLGNIRCAVALRPQVWVECPSGARYRLDFAVEPLDHYLRSALARTGRQLRVGVELDGHDFHEKSREQVTRRNRRDRELAAFGWRVLHFSGTELGANPMIAATEALGTAADVFDALRSEVLTDLGMTA